jgi:hypothetical protein
MRRLKVSKAWYGTPSGSVWGPRVSNEDQVKGESLEVHEQHARSCAEAKGCEVVEVYRLGAVSGKT